MSSPPDNPLELPADVREALGRAALDWVLQYFAQAARPPLYPTMSAGELQALVHEPLPETPQDPMRVLAEFDALAALGRKNGHPRMFGYVQSSGNFAGAVADFLASAFNQNVTSWRSAPSATTIELQVVDWIKALIGFDPTTTGLIVGGGSVANMVALAAALHASTDIDLGARGVAALPGKPRLYASDRVHMSIPKAAALLGLGRDALRIVPTDAHGSLRVADLETMLAEDRAAGDHQVAVIANAGEVNTGAIDPLGEIADRCAARRLWLHVDGSYGGFAAAVPGMRHALGAVSRADSLSLDPHKWLFAPLDIGCLLLREARHLRRAFAQSAAYIDVVADSDMSELAFWDLGPELSRRFRALKVWFALKCHGAAAFVEVIERNVALAHALAQAIDDSADFERLAPAPLSIVCFRYVPPGLAGWEDALNDFNRALLLEVQRGGESYLSNAMLGSRFALRACIVNHRTAASDIVALLDDIRRAAARMSGPRRDPAVQD